jgi:phosphate transport system protein
MGTLLFTHGGVSVQPGFTSTTPLPYGEQLAALTSQLADACGMAGRAMSRATDALLRADLFQAERAIIEDEDITALSRHAQQLAYSLLASHPPSVSELGTVVGAIHTAGDVERMSGLAAHVARVARYRNPHRDIPDDVSPLFAEMGRLARELGSGARQVVLSRDPRRAAQMRHDDDAMDDMHQRLLRTMMDRHWGHGVTCAVDLALLARIYARFGDHALQIGRRVIYQAAARQHDAPTSTKAGQA